MKAKYSSLLLLAVVAFGAVVAQNQDELPIPVENDNQFPPDNQADSDDGGIIEGSGNGAIQEPEEPLSSTTELSATVPIEDIQPTNQILLTADDNINNPSCPEKCSCSIEGDDFVINCSGQQLTEFPLLLDSRTTKLNIQNNKLTDLPKEISSLKQLKYLDASNNSIKDLALGSISELPELVKLDLSNNRLLEYPTDLKNSFGLTKLDELNLAGNDIRTPIASETLAMFTSLGKLIVPSSAYEEQLQNTLCASLKENLKSICIESCHDKEINCANDSDNVDMENEMLVPIPGVLTGDIGEEDYLDLTVDSQNINEPQNKGMVEDIEKPEDSDKTQENNKPSEGDTLSNIVNETQNTADTKSASDYSLRSAVIKETPLSSNTDESVNISESSKIDEPVVVSKFNTVVEATPEKESEPSKTDESANVSKLNTVVETTKTESKSNTDESYTVGAKTADTKTGGVDKSVIGMIVAGMVLVVAGITIKKNWSSIRRKFSSNSRTPNDRPTGNANGTTPEEVPLQDKSPV